MNKRLMLFNEFVLGPKNKHNKREGGILYASEKAIGHHNNKQRIAFGILSSCIYDGFRLKFRENEREFMIRSGLELCECLGLYYPAVKHGIELLWERYDCENI